MVMAIKINERFLNLFTPAAKAKHADEVWSLVSNAYKDKGGLIGSGFHSKEDMINNVPFWKLHKKEGKIRAVHLYRDKVGRKTVAAASDSTPEGKVGLSKMMKDEFRLKRAYSEVSGRALSFLKHHVDIGSSVIHPNTVRDISGKNIRKPPPDDPHLSLHPELKDHFYQRKIGNEWHTKLMIGTPGNRIVREVAEALIEGSSFDDIFEGFEFEKKAFKIAQKHGISLDQARHMLAAAIGGGK